MTVRRQVGDIQPPSAFPAPLSSDRPLLTRAPAFSTLVPIGWEADDMLHPRRVYAESCADMAGNLRRARQRLERLEYVSTALMGLSLALLVGAAMM